MSNHKTAILRACVDNGKITFTPKSLIDRHPAEGLEDARLEGRAKRHVKRRGK